MGKLVFGNNFYLLSLCLAIVCIYLFFTLQGKKRVTWILRVLAIALLFLSLANPSFESQVSSHKALILLDISDSLEEGLGQELLARANTLTDGYKKQVLPFAESPAPLSQALQENASYRSLRESWSNLNIGATNLEQAFNNAALEDVDTILLISDGNENKGSLLNNFNSGVAVYPLTPEKQVAEGERFMLSNLYAPLTAPEKKSVDIDVSVRNTTNRTQSGILVLQHEKKELLSKEVELAAGEEIVLTAQSEPSLEGIHEVRATLKPNNAKLPASSLTTYLSGEIREKILLINGTQNDARYLAPSLREQSYRVDQRLSSEGDIYSSDLSSYSVVILNNASRQQVGDTKLRRISKYVREGGNFIMIGGERSFGLGRYIGSPVEKILPVELVPPQTLKKRQNVAVELIIDKSRSMSFASKIEFAKEAARGVINNLRDDDYVGVIGFDNAPFEVVKLAKLKEIRTHALERVGRLYATGKTNLLPAIEEGRRRLKGALADRKHMIILTDGKIPDEGPYYVELVKRMSTLGITVSTVMLGSDLNTFMLREMARIGGGQFHQTSDARSLPDIFIKDVKVATGERTIKEQTEYNVQAIKGEIKSTSIRRYPPIRGYVQTQIKEGARLELVAIARGNAEPLLASWQVGKGSSVAFTSDANGRWSNFWISWPNYQKFWSEVIDSVRDLSQSENKQIKFNLRRFLKNNQLNLELVLFDEPASSEIKAIVILPGGKETTLTFHQVAKGRYITELNNPIAGKYEVRTKIAKEPLTPVAFSLPGELFGERKDMPFNFSLLEVIAQKSTGKLNPTKQDLAQSFSARVEQKQISHWMLVLALLLLVLEILVREAGLLFFRKSSQPIT